MTRTGCYWLALALLPLSIAGFAIYLKTKPLAPVANGTKTDSESTANGTLVYPAHVETATGSAHLSPLKSGRIAVIHLPENSPAKAGDVILELDTQSSLAMVRTAELNLQIARGRVDQARKAMENFPLKLAQQTKQLESLSSAVEQAEMVYRLSQKRFQLREIPAEELRINETRLKQAEAAVEQQQSRLQEITNTDIDQEIRIRKTELQQAEVALQQAKLELEMDSIRAPADGRVSQLLRRVGELAGPTVPTVVFQPDSDLVVRIDVEQAHVDQVRAGMEVIVRDYHRPEWKWQGQIDHIATEFVSAERHNSVSGFSDQQVVECLVVLEGDTSMLRIGQKVMVEIPRDEDRSRPSGIPRVIDETRPTLPVGN